MQRFIAIFAFALTLVFFLLPGPARADGIIIPEPPICHRPCPIPPPPPRDVPYLTVQNHRVNVTIDNQIATTRVDQIFRNDSHWSLEGTYIFPLPENAAITEFAMWIDGEKVEGQLYTKEEARRIYDNIVRRRLDPALLEYVGRDLFQASIFPIEPGDRRRVEIEYSQILPIDNGLVQYVYPLSTEKFSGKPLENVSITVEVTSREPIKAIYSPSHPVSIDRDGRYRALVGWEDENVTPTTDFSLFYTVSADDVGLNLLSSKEQGEDGFFVLLVAPNVDTEQVVDKDVILVLDTSGSMEGEKMEQARDALHFVIDHLNEGDRFNIIAFSTGVRSFSSGMEPLSTLSEARRFVDNLRPEGSTDINRALLEAINSADPERPTILIFMTDGLPTSGVVETPLILNNMQQATNNNIRIFPFGVGDDVDTMLLDSLAEQNRGSSAYVRPSEGVDERISSFYAKVSTPVLADIGLDVDGVRIDDTYPFPLPDLFAGTQLIVTGRYREAGPATITLSGEVNGQPRTFRYDDLTFASDLRGNQPGDFIPRLWATRKIGYLLNQIRLHGENKESIDEIVNLSIRYGIITPYTSFLVEEPEMALRQEGRDMIAQEAFDEIAAAPPAEVSGEAAVSKAVAQNALREAEMAAPLPASPSGIGGAMADNDTYHANVPAVTSVGNKAFVHNNGVWVDTAYDPDRMTTTPLPFPSDRFLEFLTDRPDSGKYFALGPQVIVVLDGQAYETVEGETDNIPDPLTPDEVTPSNFPQPVPQPQAAATPVTSLPPAAAGDSYTTLTVDKTEGVAPLVVNLTGELVGGPDNNRDFYCVEATFDFGDGIQQSSMPSCLEWTEEVEILRQYSANYLYEEPGEYQLHFKLGEAQSEPVTIVVTAGEGQSNAAPPAETTAPAAEAQAPSLNTGNTSLPFNCVPALMLLPFVGFVIGWKRVRN